MRAVPDASSQASAARLAWSCFGVSFLVFGVGFALARLADPGEGGSDEVLYALLATWILLGNGLVGALIASRQPANAVGWIMCALGLHGSLGVLCEGYVEYVGLDDASEGLARLAAWLSNVAWIPLVFVPTTFLLLLFPNGRLPSPRWRIAAWAAGLGTAAFFVSEALQDGPLHDFPEIVNPFGVDHVAVDALSFAVLLVAAPSVVASAVSLVVRFRRAPGTERQQIKWLALAGCFTATTVVAGFAIGSVSESVANVIILIGLLTIPVAIGIAVLRYRLYDIDLLINRTLVYVALTAVVVGVYAGIVGLAGALLHDRASLWLSLGATVIVALLFQPARSWLQRRVNRLLYGDRDDPYAAIARLGERLQATLAPEAVLPAVVEAVAQALKVPFAALELLRDERFEPAAEVGERRDDSLRLPLTYQGDTIGRLVVAPRAREEAFTAADLRLLEDLARQAGIAAHAVRLTFELQRSREQLVSAREEERRRLRRDLHDGLGPTLAGIALTLEGARNLLAKDPAAVDSLLVRLRDETQRAIVTSAASSTSFARRPSTSSASSPLSRNRPGGSAPRPAAATDRAAWSSRSARRPSSVRSRRRSRSPPTGSRSRP